MFRLGLQWIDYNIRTLAKWLAGGNAPATGPSRHWLVIAIGFPAMVALAAMLFAITPTFVREADTVAPDDFAVRFHYSAWRVVYSDQPADLLTKGVMRESFAHALELDKRHGEIYWVGLKVTKEMLDQAKRSKANQLMSGYIYGTHEAYIDNVKVASGGAEDQRRPLVVQLTDEMMSRPDGFVFSVRVRHDLQEPYPDTLYFVGIATKEQIERHRRWSDFQFNIKPAIAMGINLAFGLFFFALWACGVRKQELAAFAAFGILHSVIQATNVPLVFEFMGIQNWHRLNFVTTSYETLFTLWLGLALARIRSRAVLLLSVVLITLPWAVFFTEYTAMQIYSVVLRLWRYGSTGTYFIAAFFCFSQARLVAHQYRRDLVDGARELKLNLSWVALCLMGILCIWSYFQYVDVRIFNAVLLGGLAAVVVHDYARQDLYVRRAPLSKYHQLARLPDRVPCVLATIDLKRSEKLYRYGAERGLGGAFVVEIISNFYKVITERGGEVIQTEGDSITFFFDQNDSPDALDKAVTSVRDLDRDLRKHLADHAVGENASYPVDVRIRAALDVGAIRPVWQRFEGRDVPGWEQAQNSTIFVDVARLMEAESKVGEKEESSIICSEGLFLTAGVPAILSVSPLKANVEIKHGRRVDVSIITLTNGPRNSAAA
jgi:hypothetical protein